MVKVLRNCSGYRLEHIFVLTLKQFNRMVREVYAIEADTILQLSLAVRNASHADEKGFETYHNSLERVVKEARGSNNIEEDNAPARTDVSEKDLDSLFNRG